ncbi:MAG: hypothetical protein Kow0080_09780 [Candidatus Promineifilaceae bacterium]
MKAFNKIGFHTSVGGNPSGIGDWLKALDAAGIPFFIKAADSMTGLFDAQEIIHGGSKVPHVLVYRRSAAPGLRFDVPDYNKEPEAAAVEHWKLHKAHFPPELDKNLVWVETINELRKEVKWADWIGHFAFHTGQLAMADGYRFSAFGYSTGTPEDGAWETDGMLRYLELCQQHPEKLSVALHEYSLKVDDIWFLRGNHLGRFEKLFAACDKHGIKRPYVLITEWGWTHNSVPVPEVAMKHIREAAEYYARFPEVLGAAIWYLGSGFEGIANKAQKLIKPVTEFTVNTVFDVEFDQPKQADGLVEGDVKPPFFVMPIAEQLKPNGRFLRDVTIPDDTKLTTGQTFTKTWAVENNGNIAWGNGYKLVHTAGMPMTAQTERPLPACPVGQSVEISIEMTVPDKPGSHFSDWRFQDPQGNFFGDVIYTRIIAERPAVQTGVVDGRYVADITIPDDTEIAGGTTFTKTWRVRNTGTRAWGNGFKLVFVGGEQMGAPASVPLPAAQPGQEVNISIQQTAPTMSGMHYGDWRMQDDRGSIFGELLYLRIQVPWQAGFTLTKPLSQRDPLWADMRLGHAGSPKTIGEWGCLLTCFAMVANTFGKNITPAQLNNAMISRGGFLDLYLTKWNALSDVYTDIVYGGKLDGPSTPDLLSRIDASLAAGQPVTVHVDFTSSTPYTANDQHWVLIVGKDGDDYRINDPWLYPPQEASLRERYGRANRPLQDTIISAIFYRSTTAKPAVVPDAPPVRGETAVAVELQTGMNINPDAPHSNPMDSDDLKGLNWVRYVFKLDARVNMAERGDITKAFSQYDRIIRTYGRMGVSSLLILNQETIWGSAPWTKANSTQADWEAYADELAGTAARIARRYRRYGSKVAYQIWNEGDKQHNPASVYIEPEKFAIILQKVANAIRKHSPNSPVIFGGLATGPEESVAYLQRCKKALNGPWPVDAIGIHPYTRWATKAPFNWGEQYGTLADAFAVYRQAFPGVKFWITEIGVADDNEIGPQFYPEIGMYLEDVYTHVQERHTDLVPVVIWFAWSDFMRNAGIVDKNGKRKDHVYPAFRKVRNKELKA